MFGVGSRTNAFYSGELSYFCDGCTAEINCVKGNAPRYRCSEEENIDYCHKCYSFRRGKCENDDPDHNHELYNELGERHHMIDLANIRSASVGPRLWFLLHCFQNRKLLGRRTVIPSEKGYPSRVTYKYETYGQIRERIAPMAWQLAALAKKYEAEEARRSLPANNGKFKTGVPPSGTGRPIPPRISILLENCPAWVIFDMAAAVAGCASSPLDAAATPDLMRHIMGLAEPFCILVGSFEKAKQVRDATREMYAAAGVTLTIIVADTDLQGTGMTTPAANAVVASTAEEPHMTLSALAAGGPPYSSGKYGQDQELPAFFPRREGSDLFTLFSTSGSTGMPKLAAVSNTAFSNASFSIGQHDRRDPLVFPIYRPLSYATDRDLCWRALGSAGRIAMLEPPVERWLFAGELAAAMSSSFSAPPRIFNEMYDRFQKEMLEIEQRHAQSPTVGDTGDSNRADGGDDEGWKQWIMSPKDSDIKALWGKYRDMLGSRCTAVTTGSAPVSPATFAWMRECFQLRSNVRVFESMGTTEASGVLTDGKPAWGATVKLIPIEGDAKAQPTPDNLLPGGSLKRGEYVVITEAMVDGYFGNAEATTKLFWIDPKDGRKWMRTGDIGVFDPAQGSYSVVGRISCSVKLANGTFCNPEVIETVLQKHLGVQDIAVYVESGWTVPTAVVALYPNAKEHGIADPSSAESVCAALRSFAVAEEGVPVSLLPAALLLVPPFSREDGTLTISQKVARPGIKNLYAGKLKELHDKVCAARAGGRAAAVAEDEPGMARENSGGMELSPSGMILMPTMVDMSTGQVVRHRYKALAAPRFLVFHAFREVLRGVADIPKDVRSTAVDDATAVSLGADSVMLGSLREKICSNSGINIPLREFGMLRIKDIIARVADPSATAQAANNGGGSAQAKKATASELRKMLLRDTTMSASAVAPATDAATAAGAGAGATERNMINGNTFVTGATGFIGIHVLDALLRQSSPTAVHFAMVRGKDAKAALQRLQRASVSYRVPSVREAIKQGRIRAVLGDLTCQLGDTKDESSAKLPLELVAVPPSGDDAVAAATTPTADVFDEKNFCASVGRVFLLGAEVNHYLPYEQLRGPNVKANERLMRCFVSSPSLLMPPAIIYASSSSVSGNAYLLPGGGNGGAVPRCRPDLTDDTLSHGSGYVLSKYAAERLVESMCGSSSSSGSGGLGHPTESRIVRIGMCSWSHLTGATNTSDWLATLTCAVALTKQNPFSVFNMALVPVLWLAEELLKPDAAPSAPAPPTLSGGVQIQERSQSLRIDMSSAVWDTLVPESKRNSKPTWEQFVEGLAAISRAADGQESSSLSEAARKVHTRLELLFGSHMPRGDGGPPAVVDNAGDKLGVAHFCEFVVTENGSGGKQ